VPTVHDPIPTLHCQLLPAARDNSSGSQNDSCSFLQNKRIPLHYIFYFCSLHLLFFFLLFSSSHSTSSPSVPKHHPKNLTLTLHLTTIPEFPSTYHHHHHHHPLHFSELSFTMQGSASYPAALGSSKWIASCLAKHRYDDGIHVRTSTSKSIPICCLLLRQEHHTNIMVGPSSQQEAKFRDFVKKSKAELRSKFQTHPPTDTRNMLDHMLTDISRCILYE
jgi:hypothetical protein